MGTIESNIIDLTAYRRYREERQKTWRPLACPVCGAPATGTLETWAYSYTINQFVCSDICYEKAEETFDPYC